MRFPRFTLALLSSFVVASAFAYNSANAAIPQTLSYQGRLTDASGNPVADGTYTMRFRIYSGTTVSDFILWSSGNQSVTTQNGLFSYVLGSNTPFPADLFTNPSFTDSVRYLGIKVGTDPEILPLVRLEPTAFAHVAQTVPDNAINSAKIQNFTVTNDDIATSAIETIVVRDNSLLARDLKDEPGVASITDPNFAIIPASGVQLIDSVTISVPTSGYVIVFTNGSFNLSHNGSLLFFGSFLAANVSSSNTTAPSFFANNESYFRVADTAAFGSYQSPFSMTHTFQVTGSGQHTYYLWGETGSRSGNSSISNISMTAIYFPTAYGSVALSAPPSSQGNPEPPAETRRSDRRIDNSVIQSEQTQRTRSSDK